ncbi:M20/M25/M40 family metallo-hydrolase [Sphingoaurantiacus capsulatus]|uniref:Carboxypeptidase Q n=1 Tax=Sphingoaurantiacus capsulatus TaxID=1771310 RepID=A0ABV7XFX2_9SPHN
MRRIAALPLIALALIGAKADDGTATAAKLRDAALEKNVAWELVESLTTEVGPRLAGTPKEAQARAWGAAKLKALGFQNVRIETYDMPTWVRGEEEAWVLGEHSQPLAVTALGRSGATPAAGIEAEIVHFANVEALEAAPAGSLTGKIAFVTHAMARTQDGSSYGYFGVVRRSAPSIAATKGAVATLIRSMGTDMHRNPHTGGTNWAAGQTPIPAGALSLPDSDQLERLLKRGKPVRLKLVMTPRFIGNQQSGNVVGEIVGREAPDEVVIIGGHLDSWDLGTGAIDDGAGIAITTAAAKVIMDGKQRPRRTIRVVMWGAEEVGLLGAAAYAKANSGDKIVAAAESDFGAGKVWKFGYRVAEGAKPLMATIAKVLAPLGISHDTANTNRGGPDVQPLATLGVPTLAPEQDGSDYFDLHHTPDDTLDKIDPKALDQNVATYVAMTWLVANSDVQLGPVAAGPAR